MSDEDKMLGFCPLCMQNVEHTRRFSSLLTWALDLLTLRILRIFRIGPFYCFQCESKSLYLMPVRRNVPTFDSDTSETKWRGYAKSSRQSKDNVDFDGSPEQPAEPVGNFLRSEHSLLMQERRSRNYTVKFRDAAVNKILSGNSTLQEVRRELEVTDSDVIRWIADLMNRQQQMIVELKVALHALQHKLPENLQPMLESMTSPVLKDKPIVDGRVADN